MQRMLIVFVAATLATLSRGVAQTIDCSTAFQLTRSTETTAARLVEVKAESARDGFTKPKKTTFNTFDPKYGIRKIDVLSERTPLEDEEYDDIHKSSDIHVLFVVTRTSGKIESYKVGTEYHPVLSVVNVVHADDENPVVPEPRLAVSKREPVIRFSFDESSQGAHSSFRTLFTYVVDFRQSPPRFAGAECHDDAMGGYHAIDDSYAPTTTGSCVWSHDVDDFVCTESTVSNSGVSRSAQRRTTLLSGRPLPAVFDSYRTYPSLEAAAGSRNTLDRFVVDGLGVFERLNVADDIYVMPADEETPALRFFVFDRKKPALTEIEAEEIEDGSERVNPDDDPRSATYEKLGGWHVADRDSTLAPAAHTIRTRPLFDSASMTLIEVAELRDDVGSIYWLAMPQNGAAKALRIATSGEEYIAQNLVRRPASVSHYTIAKAKTFRAVLTVEPRTWINPDEQIDESVAECASTFALTWDGGDFVIDPMAKCVAPRRLVTITEDGTIGSNHTR